MWRDRHVSVARGRVVGMELVYAAVGAVVGVGIGLLIGALRAAGVARAADADRGRVAELERRLQETAQSAAEREAALVHSHEQYVEQIRADQAALREQFRSISAEVLTTSQQAFLTLAEERLSRASQANSEELAKREKAVQNLIEPMSKALAEVQRQTLQVEQARIASEATMTAQVRAMVEASGQLDKKTSEFINTLRRSDVRGNWGEVQLKRVAELSGMLEHVDFEEQEVLRDTEGKNLRPDMTVKLAGGRTVVVDSKVALNALMEAFATDDETVRAQRLSDHARDVRRHIDDLAGKKYWEQFDSAPEFVVMFMPSEAFYQAAVEQDSTLQEYAFDKRVVIATPTTLVAMLRTIAHAWKEEALAKNAQNVLMTGKELYDRLRVMSEHFTKVGKGIEQAGRAYNAAVSSLESRVLVTARRFGELQHITAPLPEASFISADIRPLAAPELTAGNTAAQIEAAHGLVDEPIDESSVASDGTGSS